MVSAISVIIGGIVIMNVMLVSVTLRRREIGVLRAVGATKGDILRQFMAESVLQCIAGGLTGITAGFLIALLLRTYTPFPASVQTRVAIMGVFLSSVVGLVGSRVRVTLDIEAEAGDGIPDSVDRTVTENCRSLQFSSQGFERD